MEKRHKRKMNDLKEKQKPVEEIEEQHKNDMDDLKRFYEKDKEQLEAQLRNEQLALLKSFEFEKSDIERYYQQAIEDRENEHKQEIEQLQQEHNQEIKRMGSLEKENIELKEKFSELNDKNNELTDKLQEFESQNARLKEELEKENRGKREQPKEMKGLESSSDIQRTMEELSKSNIQLANQLANEQQKCEELLKRSQELEKLYEEAQGSGDENAETSSSTADNTKAHDARNTSETEITVTTADDVESGPPLADTRQRLSATPRDELARSSSRSTPVDKEKELQDSLQQYLLELKSIQESLDTKETEMRQVKQDYEQENNRLKQSMQDLKDSINDVFDDNDEQDDDLETMKARHKQIKDIINKDQSDDKTEKRDVPTEDRNITNDDNKSPSDFRAEVDALDKIIDEDSDETKDGKQLKENVNNKLKAIKANILRMHDLELLECQQRYEKEQNNYLKELTNEKDTELNISYKVWEAVCEKLGIEGEKSKEKLQELLQKDDTIQEESNEEESEKNSGEDSGKKINTDEVEQLKREKEDLERSIGEIEKHFKKEKKKLIKKLETQHREFVLSSEAEVIDALTKEKKLLEEAFNTERFNLGRLYYMEMLDELEDLMSERKDDLEKEKSETIFKFNEDIADLLKALADKDKNEVKLLKDKNAMARKMISMQRRTNEDDKKLDDNELDDIKAEAEKLDAIIPLKKELAELQRKRQEEHERNAENLGKAVDVIKDLLADKAKAQEGIERRFSFQTLGSDYGSILGAEHEPTGRSSQLLAVGSNTPSETSRASSRSGKSKKSREPTPTLSPSRSNSRSAENAQSSPKPHSRKGTPTSSRGQGSPALSTSRSPIRGRSPGIQQEDIIEEENISNLNTEHEQQSPSPSSNILNEINSKEDLLKALESLIDDAFAEEKNYESDTSSGAISDFESQPATPKSEKEEGGSDSGAESVDSERLSIKKSDLDLALNLERFGLGRVYYNEYKDSLQDAFRKLAKAKRKSETLENKLMDDVKDLVDRTNFAKASAPSAKAETQTNADEVVDNPSPKFEKYTASGVAEQKQDDKEDIKDEPKSEEAEQESVKEKTAQEDKKIDETTDKELEQEDIPSNDTAKTQEQKSEEQPSKPNEKTKDQVDALATDEDTSSQAGVNRKTETKNAETQTDDQFIENKKTDKDDSPTDKTEDKQDLMEKFHDSEPQRKDPVDEIITEPLVRTAERIPWLGSGVPEGDFFQENDGDQQPERKDDSKDDLSSEQNADSTATEKIPDASTEPEINSTDDVTIQQAEELQSDGSQPDDVLEEKDFEGDKPNKEEQITKEEIEGKTAKGDEKKETAVDSIKDILDDETKDLVKEYKKLKDNYNILKALVGKSFVEKIPELNDNKGNEQEDDSSIDEGALKNLIEEEKCIAEDLKSIEKQLDALRNMSNSNVREEEKKLNDKELEALKELENINDQLKKEEEKDLIEHLQNEKVEVEKKLKEIERDLEEKRAHIDDKEQNVFDLLKKKLDLEGDIAKKAQKLDKHHKKLADMKQDDEAENFDREIENLKQQEKALQDLIDSHFPQLSSTNKENAEVKDPSSDKETKAQSDIGTKQGSPTNNEKQRVGKDSDGITTMQLDRPNVDDIVKQVKEQGREACKAAKKLQQAQRDKDRYNRMTEDQAQRLKPFLKKRQRLEDALGISDEQDDATPMNKPNDALSLQHNETPRDKQQEQQLDQVKPSELVDEDRRDDIKHQRKKVNSKTCYSNPETSRNRKRPSKENLLGKEDDEEPSVSKDNAREDKADKRGQQYSNKTSIFDPEALQKERDAIKDALKQVEDQIEYLTDKAKQSSYKPGVGPIVDHIQALEVEIESANENIGPIIENVKSGNNEDDIIKLIEAKSEQESQISDILSNLPDAFDSLPEDIQNAFELACLKNDLDGDIADLKSNIDKEESCFLEAVKYQREGMLDDIDSPLGEVVKSQQKLREELSDLAMQIADARDKDEMPENLQQMLQTKNEIEQQIDKLQDQIEQEPARAAEHLSELIKTKHEKEDDVMNTAHQLKEAAKEFDLHDIPEQIADVISSQNDLEDKSAISSKTKDLETEIQETAAEVNSLYQHQKNPEGKEDKLVQLINEHKSIVQKPKLNDESQPYQQPTIPPAVFATQLRKLKDDLRETKSKIKAVKDKCNDDEIDHMNKLEDLITEKHGQEKEKELFENLLDCLYKKDQLEKELKENKAKEELFEVNEVIEKKEGEIKKLKDNVEELDALLENLMNEMNNVSGETEIENTVKDTLSDIRQQLEHVEKEKEKRVKIQQNAEEHLTEAVSTLEDDLEESREELDFIENELEHSQGDPDNGGTLSKDLLDMTALLNTKKSLEDYLLEIDTKLNNSNDSEREPLSPDEINVLRAKKRDAENKLDEIQTEKSKFEIELQDDEIQETVDALTEEKKQLEMQKNALMGKIHGGNIFSRLADEMEEERPSDEDQQYYTHALYEMIAGPKTLIQLAEENEKLKDIASNQRKLLEDMNKRFRDSLGDNLANAIAPQSADESDNLATAVTPHSTDEGDNLATAIAPQSTIEGDNLATAIAPQSTDEGDNLSTAIAPQSTDEEKQSSDIPSPIIDRLANQETIQSIVSDLSNENNKLRDMNDELLNDLESLKDKVGDKLAKYLLDPNEDEDKAALGPICNLIDKDTTIQEVLERQYNDAERIKERLGKDLANALRTPTDDSISYDILMEVPRAAIIMKDTDEDLESVLAAYEDKLELLDRENNALKSMLGNDLVHALLELDQSKHHDGQPSPSMPDKKAPDNLSRTTQEDTKGLDDRSPLHHRKPIKSHSPTIDSEAASQSTGTDQGRNKPPIPKHPMRAFEKDKGNSQQPSTVKRPSKDSAADVEKIADSKRHDHGTAIAKSEEGKAGIAYPIKDDQKSTKDREMYDGEESGGNTIRELLQAGYPQRSGRTEEAPYFEHKTSLTPDVEGIDVYGMEAPVRMAKDSKTLGEVIKGYEDDLDTLKSRLGPRLYDSILASGKLKDTAGYFPADAMTSQENLQDDESAGNVSKYEEEQPETGHEPKSNPNETKATETNNSPQQLMDNAAEKKIKPKVHRRSMAGSKEQPTETSGAENSQKRPHDVRPNMNSNEYPSETSGTETGFSAKKMENVSADEHQDEQISDQSITDDLSILSQNEILDDNKTIEDVFSDLAEELKTLKSQLGSDLYNCLLATGKQSEETDKDLPSKKQQGSNYDISDILEQLSDERTIDENSKEIPDIDLSNDQDAELKVAINNQTPSRVKVPESKRHGHDTGFADDKVGNAELTYPIKKDQIQKLTRDGEIFDGDVIDDDNIHEPTKHGHPRDERMDKPTYPHQKTSSTPDMEEFDTYGMEALVRMSKDNKTLGEVIKGYEDDLDTLKSRLGPRLFDSILAAGKLVDTDLDYPVEEITPRENVQSGRKPEDSGKNSQYEGKQSNEVTPESNGIRGKAIGKGNDESPQQSMKDAVERKIKPIVPRRPMLGSKDDSTDSISTVDSHNRTKDSKPIEYLKETSGKDAGDSHKRPKDSASETANNITADKYQDEESSDQAGETSTPLTKKERRDGQVSLSPEEMVDENKTIENVLNDLAEELQILKSQLGQDLYNCLLANGRGDKTGEDDLRTKEQGSSYDISTTPEQLADKSTYDEDAKEIHDNNVSKEKNAERAMATDNQKPRRRHVPVSKQHDHGPDIADEIGDKEERFSKDDRMQKSISNEEIYDGDVDADNNIQEQEKRTDKLLYTDQKTSLTPDAEGLDMYEMEAPTRMSKDNKTLGEVIKGYENDLDTLKSRLGPRLFDSLLAAGKLKDNDREYPADAIATKEKIQDVNKAGSAGKEGLYSQEQTDKITPDSDGTIETAADSVEEKQQLMDDEVEKQMKPNVPRRTNLGSKEQSMGNSRTMGSDKGLTVSRPITGSEEYPRETSGAKGPKDTIEKTKNISPDKYEDGSSDQAREAFTLVTKLGSERDLIDLPQEKMIDENKTLEDVLSDYVEELQTLKSQIGPDLYNCLLANGKRDTRDDKDDMSKTGMISTSGISGKPTDDKRYEDSNERQDLYLTNEKGVEYPSSKDSKQPDRSRDTEAKGKGVKSRDIVPESTAQVKTPPQDDQFGQVRTNNDQEPGEILLDKLTKYGDLQAKTGDDDGNASIESGEIIDLELSMENTPTFDGNMLAPIQMKEQNQTLQDVLKGYENDLETLRDKLGPDLYNAILDAHKEKKVLGQPQNDKGAYLADVYDDEMGSRESASTKDHTQEKAHTSSAVRRPDDIEVDNILDMNDLKAEVSSKLEPTVKQSKTGSDSTLMKENDGEFMQPSASTGGDMKTERRDAKLLAKPHTTTTNTDRTNAIDNDSGDTEDKDNKDDDDKYQQPSSSAGMAMKRERMEAKPFLKASNLLREPDNTLQDIIEGYENALDALTSALGPNLTKSILDSEAKKDTKGDRKKDTKKDKIEQYPRNSLQEDSYVPDSEEQPLEKNGAAAQDTQDYDREYKTKEHETGETARYKDPSSVHDLDKEIPTKEKIKGKITDKDREQGISGEHYTESSDSGTRKNDPLTETELLSDTMTEKLENGITLEDLLRVLEQENEKLKSKLGPNLTMLILIDEDTNKATHKPMAAQGEVSTDQQQSPFDHMDEVSETKMQQDVEKLAGINDGIKEVQKPDDSLSLENQSSKQQSDDKTLNTQGTVSGKTLSVDDDLTQEQARKESDLLKNALLPQLNDDNHKTLEDVMQDLCDDLQTLKQRLGPNLTTNLLRMGRDHEQPSTESAKDRVNIDNENMDKSDEESSDEIARKNPTTGRSGSDNIPLDAERESETNILNVHSDTHQAAHDQALEVETSPSSAQVRNTSSRYSEEERPEVDLDVLAHMSDKDETLEEIIKKYEDTLDRYERALGPHLSKAILSKTPAPETLHDDHRAETQNQDQSYIAQDTENQDQSSGNQNDKKMIPTQKPYGRQLSKQEQEAAEIDEAEKEEIMKPKHKDGKRSPSMHRKKSGRCVLLGEEMTQQQSETELLEEPMKLIEEGTTLEDLIADYVEDLQTLKSIQGDDGKPLSIDDITAAYKKQIKDLEHKINEMNRDLDTLETKLGPTLFKKLSNPTQPPQIKTGEESKTVNSLEQERDSQQQTRERSEDQPNFKSKILENPLEEGAFTETTAETLRDSHKIALDKYGKSTEPMKTRALFKQGHTTDSVGNMKLSPIEAPFIMDQHNQTLEEVIAEYEAQLKEMLSNQEALKTELDTLEQSIGPKLFKELCELKEEEKEQNIEKVAEEVKEKEQQSKDTVKKGGDESKVDSEEDPKKETKFEFEAINKMNEQEKPLASVLDDYQDKCNLLEKENESLKKALSNVSGDFDVGKMISDYENKIQMLKNENKEAEKQYEEKYKELQNEIKDLRDTLEKLAQTLRQDFLEDLMKQQDTANRIEAFQKMENENKTLAEVVEEYEENMKRLEREKAVLKQLAGEGEEGASMLDTISDYEDSINSLKDVNKMLNQRIDALSKKIGPVLTEQLTELCEKTDKGSEKLEGEKTKLPAIQNMEDNNITLEDILKLYENQSEKDGDDAGLEKLEKSLGKDLMTDLNDLDNKSLDELKNEEKRPIALWIMKKRNDNLADVIKLYENYLLQYGVLDSLKGESLASELQDAFEDIPVEVKNEAIVCEAPPSELLTSEYGTMGEDDLRMTSEVESTDKDEEKENQLSELQKQLEEEKELKEKYQKDVEDLLNDIVRLKLKNASDDEDKEELERQIKEEYETKQENERTKDELIKAKDKNKELEKEREALKDEIKNMEKEIKRLEKALKGMKNDTRGNDNDLAKKIEELETKNEELEKDVEDLKSQLKEKEENYQTEKDNLIDHKDQEKKDTIKDLLKANAEVELQLQEQLSAYHDLEEKFKEMDGSSDKEDNEKLRELKMRNESLKEQLDHAEEAMKQALEKYQEQIKALETENAKADEEKRHEIELLNNKLELEKKANEKLKEEQEEILKKSKNKMEEDFESDLERERRKMKKDLEEQMDDLERLRKKHEQELNDLNEKSKKEKNNLNNLFEEEKEKLLKDFDEKIKEKDEEHEKELEKLREEIENKMIAQRAELNVQFNQEKTVLQAQIEKNIYGDEIQKSLDLESDFQGTLNKVLEEHASEIEGIDREMKQAGKDFQEEKNKLLAVFEKEREKDKREYEKLRQEMESNIENMLKEIIKLKHQRKEMRQQHRIEKQNMEDLFENERNEIQASIERSKNELLTKLTEEHENEIKNFREKYEEIIKDLQETLDKSEARKKELEEKLRSEELKVEQSNLNNAADEKSHEVQKEIKVIKRSIEVEYEQKLSVEKQRFEETLQGLRREVGTLQEKRKIIQERVYNQEGGHTVEKHVIEKSIANYKMEVLSKLEGEMAQRLNRERKPLEEEIKELQTENEELKRQRWEMKVQFRREKAGIEEKYEKEKETMEQSFNKEREDMRKRLEATLQKQEKMNRMNVSSGEALSSPRVDNTVRMLQQENLSLVTQNARLEADVQKMTEKLESIEGNFKEMVEYEKSKATRVKQIQQEMPKKTLFQEMQERQAPEYQLPTASASDDVVFQSLQEKDHQIHQLLETKRYYETVLGELCDEAGLFELDRNEVV